MDDLVGRMVAGRFDVLGRLGAGGMGTVYRAHDRELDEQVALKVLRAELAGNPAVTSQFRHEVKLARRVTHPNVARTFELGAADGLTYYTMELIAGESLRSCLDRRSPLPVAEAVEITHRLCDGLAAAHARDVIHRDIKPENVLLATDGRVVLADFGIATLRVASDGLTAGTPEYMAPEQARGDAPTQATDIYALGLVLYEMLTGKRAFAGSPDQIIATKQALDHVRLPQVTPALQDVAAVIARATARDPIARLGTASELRRMLDACARSAVSSAPTSGADGLEQRTLIVVAPQLREHERSHIAYAVYEALLAQLARVPRLRILPRLPGAADPRATAVDLIADETLHIVITPPAPARSLTLHAPLAADHVATTAAAIASAIDRASEPLPATRHDVTELVFRARALLATLDTPMEAIDLIEQARSLAPESPGVTALAAAAELRLASLGDDATPARVKRARALVAEALRVGPDLGDTQFAAGKLELNVGDSVRAARHFRSAIACDPFFAEAHAYLGRMLLEAGFLAEARARLEHAAALDPRIGMARWELARAHALDGNWDECYRVLGSEDDRRVQRLASQLRFALWGRDRRALAALRDQILATPTGQAGTLVDLATVAAGDDWLAHRERLIAPLRDPDLTPRRRALLVQVAAELAGYFDDAATCSEMLVDASRAGLFDYHWLQRCPVLEAARSTPAFDQVARQVKRRAEAVLDALYSDRDDDELAGTAVL